jgi:hypothetical protein
MPCLLNEPACLRGEGNNAPLPVDGAVAEHGNVVVPAVSHANHQARRVRLHVLTQLTRKHANLR